MKDETKNKIYWYCFKRQLEELYYLLSFERYISCDKDEFISHFTGKKFRIDEKYGGKLIWNKEKYLLLVVLNHLFEKKFIDPDHSDILKQHFDDIPDTISEDYNKIKNKPEAKKIQKRLDILFPAETGYRCKERLYYKARNKDSTTAVLARCKVIIPKN